MLSSEASAEPGQWKTDRAPYQRGIMDAVSDPNTEQVVFIKPSQVGATEMLNNIVGFYMDQDPAPILVVQPTVEMGQAWSKDRLAPMLRDSPALQDKVSVKGFRGSDDTILQKHFPGGHVTIVGANSPAGLASRPIRIVLCDEIDRYPFSAGKEGDPIKLAEKRTTTYMSNRKLVLASTPTIKDESRIERAFLETDQREYYVPCPSCDHMQTLKWQNVFFDTSAEKPEETATMHCEGCGDEMPESKKYWMLLNGEWRAHAEFKGKAGFKLNELYSPWSTWSKVVDDFLLSKDVPERLKVWTNTSLGETWEDLKQDIDPESLMARVENYEKHTLPDQILFTTAAVDTQGDRLELLVQGWGEALERWNIEQKVFYGDPGTPAVWAELDEFLINTRYNVSGKNFPISCTTIDSGGHHTQSVYDYVKGKAKRRIFAVKGASTPAQPIISKPRQVGGSKRVMLYIMGSDTAKESLLLSSLKILNPGPGYIHFANWCDQEFFAQLVSETKVKEKGKTKWKKLRERNEILDLHVMNLAAFAILNPNIAALKRKASTPQQEAAPVEDKQQLQLTPSSPPKQRRQAAMSRRSGRRWEV